MRKINGLSDKLIFDLLEAVGPSGYEQDAAKIAVRELKKVSKEIVTDNLGSAVVRIKSGIKDAPKVLLLGHVDEVGFLVRRIMKSGAIGVLPVGGIDPATLRGQRIQLLTRKGRIIYGSFRSPAKSPSEIKVATDAKTDLVADFGFDSRQKAAKFITIGDPVVFAQPSIELGGDKVLSKAVDDRLGVLAVIGAAKILKTKKLKVDVYAGFSVQEEVGLRGGKTISAKVQPDFGIISDVSNAYDVAGGEDMGKVGAGVQIRPADAATLQSDQITVWYKSLLEKHKIPYQYYFSPGGTDAGAVSLNASGVPVLQIGLVGREIHTASTLFSINDLQAAIKAIVATVVDLDEQKIKEFKNRWN